MNAKESVSPVFTVRDLSRLGYSVLGGLSLFGDRELNCGREGSVWGEGVPSPVGEGSREGLCQLSRKSLNFVLKIVVVHSGWYFM